MTLERIIIVAIVLLIAGGFAGFVRSANNFEKACRESGGRPVFDGRQYQCLKPAHQPQEQQEQQR